MAYRVISIICARGGSKGLLRKNTKLLNNEPLITRVINHAKAANCIDTILVTTDDEEIANIARSSGAEVPFIRPQELSGDLATTEKTLQHALLTYEEMKKVKYDICVFLTPTDIFRNLNWIKDSIELLKNDNTLESVFVGNKTHKNYWELNENNEWVRLKPWMKEYSSRQVRRFIVREDTGLACASRAHLWRQGKRIGDKVEILVNDDSFTNIDIHTLEDLLLAQAALDIRNPIKK